LTIQNSGFIIIAYFIKEKEKMKTSFVLTLVFMTALVSSGVFASGSGQSAASGTGGGTQGISGTVTFWDGINDMGAMDPDSLWRKDNIRLFQEKYPNVKLEFTNTPGGGMNYLTKLTTELAAGNAPDVFKCWLTGRLEPFVTAKRIRPLNSFLDARPELKKTINPQAIALSTFGDSFYALPNQKSGEVVFYNKKIFAANGISVPKTYDEFMAACAKLKAAGITPIGVGGASIWPVSVPYMMLFARMQGPALYEEVVLNHKAKWDDPAFAQTGAKLQEMVRAGIFNPNVNATNHEEARAGFGTGKFAIIFDGVWNISRFSTALGEDLGFFSFPAVPGGKGNINDQVVNFDDGFAISSNTKNLAAAEAFLEFIFSPERQIAEANGGSLIATFNKPTVPVLPIVADISDAIDKSSYGYLPWDNPLGSGMGNEFNQAVQRLYELQDPVKIFQDLNQIAKMEWN
jgi:raffinose/stachyose/melibiose transport system substrate-binding protein